MFPTILITGGCRSGKSRQALELSRHFGENRKYYLATCIPSDPEMQARVRRHQQERGAGWGTIEEPLAIPETIARYGAAAGVMLIDCLTLWISNMMAAGLDDPALLEKVDELCDVICNPPCPLVLVSNEVGAGIVPENELARRFRDLSGWTNQRVAAACRKVVWMVAGLPVTIKPPPQAGQD